jgi:DNA modification methylase
MTQKQKKAKIRDLIPDSNNANLGTERGMEMLEASIGELGFGRSILLDKNLNIIAGNKSSEVALRQGIEDVLLVESDGSQVIAVVRTDLDLKTDPKAKKIAIADNRVAEINLNWDKDVVLELAEEVSLADFFSTDELSLLDDEPDLSGEEVEEDEEAIAELQEQAESGKIESRVKIGEIWKLGRHYLACGDCTSKKNVESLLRASGEERIELLFTSPPYADMRQYNQGTDVSVNKITRFIPAWHDFVNFFSVNLGLKFKDNAVVPYWDEYISVANKCGLKLLAWNVWDKQQAGSIAAATNMFWLSHEWIFVFGESRKKINRTIPNQLEKYKQRHGENFLEDGMVKSVRQFDGTIEKTTSTTYLNHQMHSVVRCFPELSNDVRKMHPAVFPIELPTQYMEAMTDLDDVVADSFLGSGTTLIAAQRMEGDRVVVGFEISPDYCEVICRRFEALTGVNAELVGTLD